MADVKIRNLDDHLYEMYRGMADDAGISLEEQLRRVLAAYVSDERRAMIERLREGRERLRAKYGVMPDSTPGIRAERDEA
jgi:plasmid stability protein